MAEQTFRIAEGTYDSTGVPHVVIDLVWDDGDAQRHITYVRCNNTSGDNGTTYGDGWVELIGPDKMTILKQTVFQYGLFQARPDGNAARMVPDPDNPGEYIPNITWSAFA